MIVRYIFLVTYVAPTRKNTVDQQIKGPRPHGHRKRAHFTTFHMRKLFQTIGTLKIVDVTIIGREHVPRKERAIIGPNHVSMLDILFVWTALRGTVVALGAAEMFKLWFAGWLGKLLGFIPVVRKLKDGSNADEAAQSGANAKELMAEVLENDGALILFSEGRCVSPGDEQDFFPGAAVLAFKTDAKIVPCYLHGPNKVMPLSRDRKGKKILYLKEKVFVIFGPALDPKNYENPEDLTKAHRTAVFSLASQVPSQRKAA